MYRIWASQILGYPRKTGSSSCLVSIPPTNLPALLTLLLLASVNHLRHYPSVLDGGFIPDSIAAESTLKQWFLLFVFSFFSTASAEPLLEAATFGSAGMCEASWKV